MSREAIEKEVAGLLRETSLQGSGRAISLADPLGELGLGLDSLGLIQFVTALEKKFRIPMPDDIWTARGQLTLNHFVDIIAESQGDAPAASRDDKPSPPAAAKPKRRKSTWIGWTLLESLYRIRTRRCHILERRLSEQPIPDYSPSLPLVARRATPDDEAAVARFCESSVPQATFNKRKMTVKLFHALLASGHTCYAAWLDGDIVGWDWVWTKGFVCRYTGLRLEWPEDTCYAGELFEDSRYGGKGVGLALLSHSLRAAQEQGYARQVCWVDSKNKKMLSGAIQLFDFEIIGEIRRKGLFPLEWTRLEGLFTRLSVSRWENRGRAGRGGTLVL